MRADAMASELRILLVEDVEDDAKLLVLEIRRGGHEVVSRRVEDRASMTKALEDAEWDLVLSDFRMPGFDAMTALQVLLDRGLDLPFIIVSGNISEESAVAAMKAGAHDFVLKGNLGRLVPAIERELREARGRRERARAEADLRASEQRFRTLVSSMEEIVFTLDPAKRYSSLFGRRVETGEVVAARYVGKTAQELFDEEGARPHEEANARALAGERIAYEWSVEHESGTRHFQTSLAPLFGEDAQRTVGAVGVAREITDEKRMHAQLLVSDRMATIGTLAAGVAHEINNPLAAVIANIEFLADALASDRARNREVGDAFEDTLAAATRVREIVADLRVFSRAGSGDKNGPIDVEQTLDSTARLASSQVRHRAKLVRDFGRVPLVFGSDARLGQVFLNMIVNASQAIEEGRPDANEIRLVTRRRGDEVLVEVRDTGRGMPADVKRKLFEPFFTTKPAGIGTGLGLSICQRIVTDLGGRIEVDSELGRGSTFTVVLKLAGSAGAPSVAPPSSVTDPSRKRGRVLVVEDDAYVANALRRTIAREHDVVVAASAAECLALLDRGERFHVVLCDVTMPGMSGVDLFDEISKRTPEQASRFVFVTGGAVTERARAFLASVPNPVLEKPYQAELLRRTIREVMSAS